MELPKLIIYRGRKINSEKGKSLDRHSKGNKNIWGAKRNFKMKFDFQ